MIDHPAADRRSGATRKGSRIVASIVLASLLLTGCAGSLPQPVVQLQHTLEALCALYETNRGLVVSTRAYLISTWDAIPAETQDDLLRVEAALPAIDKGGRDICEVARATAPLVVSASERDKLAGSLIRLVSIGIQLKAQGVI